MGRMTLLFLGYLSLVACVSPEKSNVNRDGVSTPAASKKVNVEVVRDNRISLQEVSTDQLRPVVSLILGRELTLVEQEKLLPMLQLMRSSCATIWEQKGSIAQGLILPDCLARSKDSALVRRMSRDLAPESNRSVEDIVSSLALTGPYFQERDQGQAIEVWLSVEKPFLSEVIGRAIQLSANQLHFYFWGEQEHPQLGSHFVLNLSEENRQKLTKWVAGGAKIEQFVSMIEPNVIASSMTQNQKSRSDVGVRSSPTWFVKGYRLRGLQSVRQIERFYQYP